MGLYSAIIAAIVGALPSQPPQWTTNTALFGLINAGAPGCSWFAGLHHCRRPLAVMVGVFRLRWPARLARHFCFDSVIMVLPPVPEHAING
jgi:hypothetical protein